MVLSELRTLIRALLLDEEVVNARGPALYVGHEVEGDDDALVTKKSFADGTNVNPGDDPLSKSAIVTPIRTGDDPHAKPVGLNTKHLTNRKGFDAGKK